MVGSDVPIWNTEHQYFITEPINEFVERHEESEACNAFHTAREGCSDPVLQVGRDEAVLGRPFGCLGAALRRRDLAGGLGQQLISVGGQTTAAQSVGGDQGPVHQQVRIAANRRGEMGVARQGKAEMAARGGAIDRLALRPQDQAADHAALGQILGQVENALE